MHAKPGHPCNAKLFHRMASSCNKGELPLFRIVLTLTFLMYVSVSIFWDDFEIAHRKSGGPIHLTIVNSTQFTNKKLRITMCLVPKDIGIDSVLEVLIPLINKLIDNGIEQIKLL